MSGVGIVILFWELHIDWNSSDANFSLQKWYGHGRIPAGTSCTIAAITIYIWEEHAMSNLLL